MQIVPAAALLIQHYNLANIHTFAVEATPSCSYKPDKHVFCHMVLHKGDLLWTHFGTRWDPKWHKKT